MHLTLLLLVRMIPGLLCLPQAPASQPVTTTEGEGYIIGPQDLITVVALDAEEISKQWRVSLSGYINLPMIGRIQASGKTTEALEADIARRLSRYVKNPQVSLFVTEFHSRPVALTGAVAKPGTLQLTGRQSLYDVIVAAGVTAEGSSTLTLTRPIENGRLPIGEARDSEDRRFTILEIPVKEVMDGRSEAAQLEIVPNDMIHVDPQKQQRLVQIAGEVNRPGSVELVTQETISLMKLLAVAGGLTRTASAKSTLIVHINQEGVQTSSAYIDLNRIIKGQSKDIELLPGDVILVPSSRLAGIMQTLPTSAINTGLLLLGRF